MAALRAGNCTVQPSESGGVECLVSLTGNQFERTPKHALTLLSRYEQPLFNTDMNWFVEGNGIYQGKRFIDESNIKQLDSYWVADFRVGVTSERWDFLVYLDNAFNDDTVKTAVDAGGDVDATLTPGTFASTFSPADNVIATLPDPQTWGVRANVRF